MSYYTLQGVIDKLAKKGFTCEASETHNVLHFKNPGLKEIKMQSDGVKHYFQVLKKITTNLRTAMEWAGVEDLEDVA